MQLGLDVLILALHRRKTRRFGRLRAASAGRSGNQRGVEHQDGPTGFVDRSRELRPAHDQRIPAPAHLDVSTNRPGIRPRTHIVPGPGSGTAPAPSTPPRHRPRTGSALPQSVNERSEAKAEGRSNRSQHHARAPDPLVYPGLAARSSPDHPSRSAMPRHPAHRTACCPCSAARNNRSRSQLDAQSC